MEGAGRAPGRLAPDRVLQSGHRAASEGLDARTADHGPTALLMGAQTQIHVPLPFSARQCSGFSFNVSVSSYVRVQVD